MQRLKRQRDFAAAAEVDSRLALLHQNLFLEANPVPVKWALAKMGLIAPGIRLPLVELDVAPRLFLEERHDDPRAGAAAALESPRDAWVRRAAPPHARHAPAPSSALGCAAPLSPPCNVATSNPAPSNIHVTAHTDTRTDLSGLGRSPGSALACSASPDSTGPCSLGTGLRPATRDRIPANTAPGTRRAPGRRTEKSRRVATRARRPRAGPPLSPTTRRISWWRACCRRA